jgi:hypothetical protein
MTKKIYAFCNLIHNTTEEFVIRNHPIIAINEEGTPVGHWISSNHSFGRLDIVRSLDDIGYQYELEWIEDIKNHPMFQIMQGKS